eukprot:93314-Pelagomonas_calceolata.AAC.5
MNSVCNWLDCPEAVHHSVTSEQTTFAYMRYKNQYERGAQIVGGPGLAIPGEHTYNDYTIQPLVNSIQIVLPLACHTEINCN